MEKVIGVTLLFTSKKGNTYTALLKSYVLSANTWRKLKLEVSRICKLNLHLDYIGIEDVFYVSGTFKEREILGKSYLDNLVSIKDAKTLLSKEVDYSCKFQPVKNENKAWYLVSLIYFYNDVAIKDKLTISCYTPIKADNLDEVKIKIRKYATAENFVKKILLYSIDKMNWKNLKFIGIEDVSRIDENAASGEAFEVTFAKYRSVEKIKMILPKEDVLKLTFKKTIDNL